MKKLNFLLLGLLIGSSAQAALVKFQLSPPGSDSAVGLSPSNQVPQATPSTGSGGEISGGIVFDTESSVLLVTAGYGSAAGFSNLTGPALAMHIHGPAGAGTNAGILVDLTPYNFPASDPTNGGVIAASIDWPTNETAALLAGRTYLNIHTATYTNGEIRGQLVPVNEKPVVVCPSPATVECGGSATLVTLFSDAEGDALSVVWAINGTPVVTNAIPARKAGYPAMDSLTQNFPTGTNIVQVSVTDPASNTVSCATQIVVADAAPPVITSASANPSVLWPPNHKMVDVTVRASVADTCSGTTWKIIAVKSNEGVKEKGSGNTSPDWVITGDHTVQLRAERSGKGSGRIYTISLQARNAAGEVSRTKTVTVLVPKSQGKGHGGGNEEGNDQGNDKGHGNGKGNGKGK